MNTQAPAEGDTVTLHSIPETAKRLDCSVMHVYRLHYAGVLRTVDIAEPGSSRSKLRVRSDDLAAYIHRQTINAITAPGA